MSDFQQAALDRGKCQRFQTYTSIHQDLKLESYANFSPRHDNRNPTYSNTKVITAYVLDGQNIATRGDDGKGKVWSRYTGLSISSVAFAKQSGVLFLLLWMVTVRTHDLIRYRNLRTFMSPSPVQFSFSIVDSSGEAVAAGSTHSFEVFRCSADRKAAR